MLGKDFGIINAGLPLIVEGVSKDRVTTLEWEPPAFGDVQAARLAAILNDTTTEEANREAVGRVHSVRPQLIDVRPASEVIPGFSGYQLGHAGPPIQIERMCGPMKGALIGAAIFEGWAATPEDALELLNSGRVGTLPCHSLGAVGPMAGVLSPSMPVLVVEADGRRAYSSLNEGLGKVLRFGAFDDEVITRLRWFRDNFGPTLSKAIRAHGPIDTTSLFGQALTMGDEAHNRNVAGTSLFARLLSPFLAEEPGGVEALRFLAENDHFTLNLSMAAAKLCMDAARGTEGSSIVTAMARNGVDFGLQLAGTGDEWFTAPVGPADGLFFPGFSIEDANPDLGDSAITETLGLGGVSMAAAPAITRFVGGTPGDALALTIEMGRITEAPHPAFQIPSLGFAGSPSGINIIEVLEKNILPVINTGIAHKEAGVGQIGAGIVRAPKQVFQQAIKRLADLRGVS